MTTKILALTFAISLCVASAGQGASQGGQNSLIEAIFHFNKKSLSDSIGASQAPITEEEVVAAILLWESPSNAPISDELLGIFKSIAESKALPGNAIFESLNGYDRGGSHIFDVWSVRIKIERAGSSYAFVIRERVVGSRTLSEELARLSKRIEEKGIKRWVGGYRILERKNELMARIKKAAK